MLECEVYELARFFLYFFGNKYKLFGVLTWKVCNKKKYGYLKYMKWVRAGNGYFQMFILETEKQFYMS